MTYAARADLEARFGTAEVEDLARDDAGRIDAALADAAAEIDAALATLYVLPLPAVRWPELVHIACNLARGNLYDDRESEAVTARRRSARARLMRLAEDKTVLVDEAGNRAPKRESAKAERTGPERVMTPDNLAGL